MTLLSDLRADIGDDGLVTSSGVPVLVPGVSTDNAIARWDGTIALALQNSSATIDDNGNIVTNGGISFSGYFYKNIRIVTVAGPITVLANDNIIMVNKTVGAATALTLPPPILGHEIIVKDAKGDAFTNNITVSPTVGFTIDGGATSIINQNYQSLTFIYNGTEWNVIS